MLKGFKHWFVSCGDNFVASGIEVHLEIILGEIRYLLVFFVEAISSKWYLEIGRDILFLKDNGNGWSSFVDDLWFIFFFANAIDSFEDILVLLETIIEDGWFFLEAGVNISHNACTCVGKVMKFRPCKEEFLT